jgi:hypothetical protein
MWVRRLDDTSGMLGRQIVGRHADDDLQGRVDRQTERHTLRRDQGEATKDSSGDVVGMTFDLDRLSVDAIGTRLFPCQAQGGSDGGYRSCGRRSEPLAERDIRIDLNGQREAVTNNPTGRTHHKVTLTGTWLITAYVLDLPFLGTAGLDRATDLEGQRQTVEAGPEIGRGGRGRGRCGVEVLAHPRRLFRVSVAEVGDIFDFENLLPELVVGLGLALIVGNGLAWWRHQQGRVPQGVDNPQYRAGRVVFLIVVGVLMTAWGAVSLLT